MTGMPADTVWVNGAKPVKGDIRRYMEERTAVYFATADDFRAEDPTYNTLVYIGSALYAYDSGDVATLDSTGALPDVLVTNNGKRYKRVLADPQTELLCNAAFRVAQRGTSFTAATTPANNNDTYLLDRWVHLSDGNDAADVTIDSDGSLKFESETADKQFGIVQILEEKDCRHLIGEFVSIAFRAKATGITKVRCAVLSWDGTADTVTSDVVSAWAGAGTEPTWAANWTREGSVLDLNLTTSFVTAIGQAIAIDTASAKQVAVVLWVDDTTITIGDTLNVEFVSAVHGELYPVLRPVRPISHDMSACQRYYEQSALGWTGFAASTTLADLVGTFKHKRVAPTISLLDTSIIVAEADQTSQTSSSSTLQFSATTTTGARITVDGFTSLPVEYLHVVQNFDWLAIDAEL